MGRNLPGPLRRRPAAFPRRGPPPASLRGVSTNSEADGAPAPDATLGGYLRVHNRPPAFEGSDGHPYTVSIEVEKTANLRAPWAGFLVFPRWAATGLGVIGHVETPVLWEGTAAEQVVAHAGQTPLLRVKQLLDDAIRRRVEEDGE